MGNVVKPSSLDPIRNLQAEEVWTACADASAAASALCCSYVGKWTAEIHLQMN